MNRYEVRKEETKQRINSLEKRRDELYDQTGKIEDEIIDMGEKAIERQETLVNLKKKVMFWILICNF
ncbi:hypothetical protein TMUPMC115_2309 [Tetragenococcus muriaticus PMC-11-5]|uniref:Uncharacterized protein n=1 Tax=Tetragenococcus muriaticus PMC-11-5 TaxID=1302649 RepID=A0A091BY74_9ENTE|nr:hypothetical protein [Tetragenococcus muriaticus]KFN89684.1 hypothetical protein TMUPMC115_2309 [Tetragenococcus muriaticus PMC-11-5]